MSPQTIISFCIGPVDATMYSLIGVLVANTISKLIDKKEPKPIAEEFIKTSFAYLIFIVIANRMDAAGITAVMGWKSTQYLVVIGLAARETIDLLKRISTAWGITIPGILEGRLTKIERGEVEQSPDYIDPNLLDQRIQNLRQNMDKLKELRMLEKELYDLGGVPHATSVSPVSQDMGAGAYQLEGSVVATDPNVPTI